MSTKALNVLALVKEAPGTSLRMNSLQYLNHGKCCGIMWTDGGEKVRWTGGEDRISKDIEEIASETFKG